ncbi:MAG: isocitrate/isopropylmalate dehydrogenase family protein [Acidobacteria bacterium]|nr:isocitrate/isopropylmalate dehydrogenase family protein [Acidobacteriota bacterium]
MARLALIPGDGIGPEVMAEAVPLLESARSKGCDLSWEVQPWGADHFLATGEMLPEAAFETIRDSFDAVLFGAVGDPRVPDNRHAEAILLKLRQGLELSVNHRPCAPMADALVPLKGVSAASIRLEVFRENTEGPYCLQGWSHPDRAMDEARHSETAIRRLLEAAFTRAEEAGRPLTLAHKANVLKHGHGLWMRVFGELREAHPSLKASSMHADALLCALVQRPSDFGLIAGDNFVGDLVSDLTAAYMGGMGVAPSLSYAPHRPFRCTALAEPVHGSAPDLAGRGIANPTGMILSTALLFRHLGWHEEAERIQASVANALKRGAATPDLGGSLTTSAMGAMLRAGLA